MFPSVPVLLDYVIVDLLYLLRSCICEYRFENELVVVLIVETAKQRVDFHKLNDRFVVVVDYGVLLCFKVFEDEKPIVCKNLAVENLYHTLTP